MFTLDIPDVPQHYASVVIGQSNQAQAAPASKERAMGVCFGVNYNPTGQEHSSFLSPEYAATGYFSLYENLTVNEPPSSNVKLVEPPKHGKVTYAKYEDGLWHHQYIPELGYVGDDKIVFKVNVDGKTVKLVYLLKVSKTEVSNQSDDVFCKKTGTQWKISLPNVPADAAAMQSLLDGAGIGSAIKVEVADLPAGAVGQTTGTAITLDDNAAGHSWFIDYTPWLNEEYLPTYNPYEWQAKEGTEAYGKINMLSVLLHEYGHGRHFEVHYMTVSRAVRKYERRPAEMLEC